MICPECGERWAPRSSKDWEYGEVEDGETLVVPLNSQAEENFNKAFDDDHKVVCSECRL